MSRETPGKHFPTPEMVKVGAEILSWDEHDFSICPEAILENVARRIFSAMMAAAPSLAGMDFGPSPCSVLSTQNGTVQVSRIAGDSIVGLLVERDGVTAGTLLTDGQAELLAKLLASATWRVPADYPWFRLGEKTDG